jgi:hypothetical protein
MKVNLYLYLVELEFVLMRETPYLGFDGFFLSYCVQLKIIYMLLINVYVASAT